MGVEVPEPMPKAQRDKVPPSLLTATDAEDRQSSIDCCLKQDSYIKKVFVYIRPANYIIAPFVTNAEDYISYTFKGIEAKALNDSFLKILNEKTIPIHKKGFHLEIWEYIFQKTAKEKVYEAVRKLNAGHHPI